MLSKADSAANAGSARHDGIFNHSERETLFPPPFPRASPAISLIFIGLQRVPESSSEPGHPAVLDIAATRKLRELVTDPLGEWISTSFRVVPQQDRSLESVDRMLAALELLMRLNRQIDELSLETVASAAHVTPQAAYRYFRDVHDLVRLFVRRIQTVEQGLLMAVLLERHFDDSTALADSAISFIIDAFQQLLTIPARLQQRLLRDYLEIPYRSIRIMSEIICATLLRRGDPCAGLDAVSLASALVAALSVGASFLLNGGPPIALAPSRDILMRIFLAALENSRDPLPETP